MTGGDREVARRTWSVGRRVCTLVVHGPDAGPPTSARIEWAPAQPARLTTAEREQYRAGRDAALRDIAAELGISVAVLEV